MATASTRSDPADRGAPIIRLDPGMSREEIWAAYGLTCPPRVGTVRDPSRKTYGRAVARVAARLGTPMMPWQRYSADTALEVDPETGWLGYRNVRLLTPRQSGKTTEILSVEVHRMTEMGQQARRHRPGQGTRQRALYAAQKRLDARDKFVDEHLPLLKTSPYSGRYRERLTNGHEALLWDTGGYQGITASGETSGHGKVLDLGVEDEAFAAEDNRLEQAFSPAMITRWSPQHWIVSTEGTEKSLYLAEIVDAGREMVASGQRGSICYMEWSNLDGARDDPETWLSCMPALCPTEDGPCRCDPAGVWHHTVTIATIRAELEKMARTPDEFDRAYLNRRKHKRPPVDPNVPTLEQWSPLADVRSQVTDPVAFAVDITPARTKGAIIVVGPRPDGHRHVELIEHRDGTDWIVPRLCELRDKWAPVAFGLDVAGPGGSLLIPLAEAGIVKPDGEPKRGQLAIPSTREVAAACGRFADAIRQGTLRHRDQAALTEALASARTRPLGDAWAWARRAGGDISPLVAATVGLWAYETRKHLTDDGDYDVLASVG